MKNKSNTIEVMQGKEQIHSSGEMSPELLHSIDTITTHYLAEFPQEEERLSLLREAIKHGFSEKRHLHATGIIVSPNHDQILMIVNEQGMVVPPGKEFSPNDISPENSALLSMTDLGFDHMVIHPWHQNKIPHIPLDINTHRLDDGTTHFEFSYTFQSPIVRPVPFDPRELEGIQWTPIEDIHLFSFVGPIAAKLHLLTERREKT